MQKMQKVPKTQRRVPKSFFTDAEVKLKSADDVFIPFLLPRGLPGFGMPSVPTASDKLTRNAENAESAENPKKSDEKLILRCRNASPKCHKPCLALLAT